MKKLDIDKKARTLEKLSRTPVGLIFSITAFRYTSRTPGVRTEYLYNGNKFG